MLYLCVVLFLMCATPYIGAMDLVTSCSTVCQQEQSEFVQLPAEILSEIAGMLPQSDVAHVKQTCRLLNRYFVARVVPTEIILKKIDLDDLVQTRPNGYSFFIGGSWTTLDYLNRIFERVSECIRKLVPMQQPLLLDLSGFKIEMFMIGDHPECNAIKKLVLRSCAITSERDHFFKESMWSNLQYLDLASNFLGQRDRQVDSGADWDSGADIWPSIYSLPNLKVLILRNNKMAALPPELFKMTGLTILDMRNNPLTSQQLDELVLRLPSTTILR
ncbi:MAG TPA: leucine-rich repeat domain-containing protein [Candidatus Dependentiae bacterium]|nr:leucine-rich repeat domain-containing protein [Candidatus Dependentiae bacterium]